MIYLAGKLTGKLYLWNMVYAWWWARKLNKAGLVVFSPHLNFWNMGLPYEGYMTKDFAVIDRCDAVYLLPNWKRSSGAIREYAYAKKRGIKIVEL